MAEADKENAAKLKKMQTDLDKMKKVAKKLLQQKQQHEAQIKALQKEIESKAGDKQQTIDCLMKELDCKQSMIDSMKQTLLEREDSESDPQKTQILKLQMHKMTEMMQQIEKENESQINELSSKLTISEQRTEEIMNESALLKEKYDSLRNALKEEELRSSSLMDLNGALKQNMMKLHNEKDELEESIDEIHEKYLELSSKNGTHSHSHSHSFVEDKSEKIRDLQAKTLGFKQSIDGLKDDMTSIAIGFQKELLSSTKGLAAIHNKQQNEKQKMEKMIQRLQQEKNEIFDEFERYKVESMNDKKTQNVKSKECNDEMIKLKQENNSLIANCKDLEQNIHKIEREYDEYKAKSQKLKNEICAKYECQQNEKDKANNDNLQKAVEKYETMKNEMNQMLNEKESEISKLQNENEQNVQKLNDLHKINEKQQNELNIAMKKMEEIMCQNENNDNGDSNGKELIDSKRRTPNSATNSMDFSNEIHVQLKDENVSLHNDLNKLQNENEKLCQNMERIQKENDEKSQKLAKYSTNLKTAMQKLKQYKSEKTALETKLNENETKLTKELTQSKENEQVIMAKLDKLAKERASELESNQILQMEHEQIKKENLSQSEQINELKASLKEKESEKERMKSKYKAYINKQKKEINAMSPKVEKLTSLEQSHNELQQEHMRLSKEYESKSIMVDEYESASNEKYEKLKNDFDQSQIERNELQKRCQTLSNENEVLKNEKIALEQSHKETMTKYKEKAKNVINKHKNSADEKVKIVQNEKNALNEKIDSLMIEINEQQQTKNVFEQSIASLNEKLRNNQTEIEKLSKQSMDLKETNDALEDKHKLMMNLEKECKEKDEMFKKIKAALTQCSFFKTEDAMNDIVECVHVLATNYENIQIEHSEKTTNATEYELKLNEQTDKIKRLAVTIRKLQNIRTKLQKNNDSLKEKLSKTESKSEQYHKSLMNIHSETLRSLDKWKVFMNEGSENQNNEGEFDENGTEQNDDDEQYLKRCLSDVRSLTMYFIQILDMYREKKEQHEGDTSELKKDLKSAKEEIEKYKTELNEASQHIEHKESSQIAKNAMIEKLTEKFNHSIECHAQNWHFDLTKADFVDLSVSTRLVIDDDIWCLIRWRQKLPKIASIDDKENEKDSKKEETEKKKYKDLYFWSLQQTYLSKLNVNENEIYLPDFFENKLENQITKTLENKWKAIQRRTERSIQELKVAKDEEIENKKHAQESLREYKVKCKVILQKQKDQITSLQAENKELETLRNENDDLKKQISASEKSENWEKKCDEIETKLAEQSKILTRQKYELAECQTKILLKERQLNVIKEEFDKEKDEIRGESEKEAANAKKKYAQKLEDYRLRARKMLEEKDKQLLIARSRLKSARNSEEVSVSDHHFDEYSMNAVMADKEIQTERIMMVVENNDNVMAAVNEVAETKKIQKIESTDDLIAALQPPMNAMSGKEEDNDEMISSTNIEAMAQMQMKRDYKIREFEERVRRLQELLNKSENEQKEKDAELSYLKHKFEQIEQVKDVKKSADNSEYLKNALLQYFDGKIGGNQLLSVVAVGLRFNDEEQKKAKNSKLISEDSARNSGGIIGGYVKSWWN